MQDIKSPHLAQRMLAATRQALRRGVVDLATASGIVLALGFVQNIFLARALGPDGLGHLSVVNTVLNLGSLAATAGITTAVLRYSAAERDPAAAWTVYRRGIGLTTGVGLAVVATLSLWSRTPLWAFDPVAGLWLPLAALTLPLRSAASCATEFAQSRERTRTKATLDVTAKALMVLGIVLGGLARGFPGAIVGLVVGTTLGSLVSLTFVRRLRPERTAEASVSAGEMLRFGLWGLSTNLLATIVSTADVLVLSALLDQPSLVGYYSIAVVLQQLGRVPLLAYLDARFPEMARTAKVPDDLAALWRRMRRHLLLFAVPNCAAAALVAPWIVPWVFGAEYEASVRPLQILLLRDIAFATAAAQGRALLAAGNVQANFRSAALMAVTSVSLNLLLIPWLGLVGSAIASVASQVLWAIATLAQGRSFEASQRR